MTTNRQHWKYYRTLSDHLSFFFFIVGHFKFNTRLKAELYGLKGSAILLVLMANGATLENVITFYLN